MSFCNIVYLTDFDFFSKITLIKIVTVNLLVKQYDKKPKRFIRGYLAARTAEIIPRLSGTCFFFYPRNGNAVQDDLKKR